MFFRICAGVLSICLCVTACLFLLILVYLFVEHGAIVGILFSILPILNCAAVYYFGRYALYGEKNNDTSAIHEEQMKSEWAKFENTVDAVLSLKKPEITVKVIGHSERTLQLRCGFVVPEPKAPNTSKILTLRLLNREQNAETERLEGLVFRAELPNKKLCLVALKHSSEPPVEWIAKTFFPIQHEDWFSQVGTEDMAIKDDKSLRSIDRIEWHRKLVSRVEQFQRNEHD